MNNVKLISYILYALPFSYTYYTRIAQHGTWFLLNFFSQEHFLILFGTYYILYGFKFQWQIINVFLPKFILSYILFHCLYEIGYSINDLISVNLEINPTYRIDSNFNLKLFIIFRAMWFGVLLTLISRGNFIGNILAVSAILMTIFIVHNFIAIQYNTIRIFTFSSLRILRYTFIPYLLAGSDAVKNILIIMFPILMLSIIIYTIEKIGDNKVPSVLYLIRNHYITTQLIMLPLQVFFLGFPNISLLIPNCITIGLLSARSRARWLYKRITGV